MFFSFFSKPIAIGSWLIFASLLRFSITLASSVVLARVSSLVAPRSFFLDLFFLLCHVGRFSHVSAVPDSFPLPLLWTAAIFNLLALFICQHLFSVSDWFGNRLSSAKQVFACLLSVFYLILFQLGSWVFSPD